MTEQTFTDLNVNRIRAQIDHDFPNLVDTNADHRDQKDMLTWLELRNRLNQREAEGEKQKAVTFENCVDAWSKGDMSYQDLLKQAKQVMAKPIESAEQKDKVEKLCNHVGTLPLDSQGLGIFKRMVAAVVGFLKQTAQQVSHLLHPNKPLTADMAGRVILNNEDFFKKRGLTPTGKLVQPINPVIHKVLSDRYVK